MTVNTVNSIAEFETNGVTTNYPFYFKFLANEDLVVTYIDPNGVSSTLTLGTQYTANGVGNDQGGSVITTTALAGPGQLVVSREMDTFQQTSLRNQGKFLAETHEDVFDRLTMLIQQGFSMFTRALKRPLGRDYFFAENRRITGVKDPVDSQDAATKKSVEAFVASVLETGQGPVNNAANVIYAGPNGEVRVVQDLSGAQGSSLLGHVAEGANAAPRTIQQKLRDVVSRQDYATAEAFDVAKAGKPNINADGNFDAKVKPAGEQSSIDLSVAAQPVIGQGRARINYFSPQQIEAYIPENIVMGGFRFAGSYKKGRAPSFPSGVNGKLIASLVTNLGAESTVHNDNWYALFACANSGGAIQYKLMPFIRVGSVAGSNCSLTYAGEGANAHSINPVTYTWSNNVLNGVDCLAINEGPRNRFSGRVTKITANAPGGVTLNAIGTVGPYDFLLPAPPNFEHYAYLGSFYRDIAEVRNIADSGTVVDAYMARLLDPNWAATGAVAFDQPTFSSKGVPLNFGGYISPLATAVIATDAMTISTATTSGVVVTNYSHDSSNHVIAQQLLTKQVTANVSGLERMQLAFSISQLCYMYTSGSLEASRVSGTLQIGGWIEP